MYHVNPETEKSGKCRAKKPENCRFKNEDGSPIQHFDSQEDADKHISEKNKKENSKTAPSLKKEPASKASKAVDAITEKYDGDLTWLKPKLSEYLAGLDNRANHPTDIALGELRLGDYRDRGASVITVSEALEEMDEFERYSLENAIGTEVNGVKITEDTLIVAVYTRNGGGNRESVSSWGDEDCPDYCTGCQAEALEDNPYHIYNEDDSFDRTYANFYYVLPSEAVEEVEYARAHEDELNERARAENNHSAMARGDITPWSVNDPKKYREITNELHELENDKKIASRVNTTSDKQAMIDYSEGKEYDEKEYFHVNGYWRTIYLSDVAKAQEKHDKLQKELDTYKKLKDYSDNVPEELQETYKKAMNLYSDQKMYYVRRNLENLKKETLTPFRNALSEAKRGKKEDERNVKKLERIEKDIEKLKAERYRVGWDDSQGEPPQLKK